MAERRGGGVLRGLARHPVPAMLRMLPGISRPLTAALVPLLLLGGLAPILQAIAVSVAIGAVPDAVRRGLASPAGLRMLLGIAGAALGVVLVQAALSLRAAVTDALGRRLNGRLSEQVMTAVAAPASIRHVEDPELGARVAQARGIRLGGVLPGQAVTGFGNVASAWLTALGAAAVLATFRWWLAAALVAAWLVTRHRLVSEADKLLDVVTDQSPAMRRADYFRGLAMTPGAAKEIRIFSLGGWVTGQFRQQWLAAMAAVWRQRRRGRAGFALSIALLMAAQLAALVLVAQAGASGELGVGRLALFLQALLAMGALTQSLQDDVLVRYGLAALPGVEAVKAMAGQPSLGLAGDRPASGLPAEGIALEGVSFRYREGGRDVLAGVDLDIFTGESLAIVGLNGSGKTTLAKLLCRLYDPTGGRILVDGVDLRDLDPGAWQGQVAAVFQDFVRYPLSAADNVGFGSLGLAGDHEAVVDCARRAGALELLEALPDGWETVLSTRFGGVDLSGGEWQRIALARSLLAVRGGARVLVLDEPTASLDVRAEAAFFERFLDLTRGLTTIVISHRFATVRQASRICVLEAGRVVELGTHDELVAAGGRYARMFELQASALGRPPEEAVLSWGGPR
jgi:ATP-binding cassette, subfamily B, bacterial